MRFTLVALVAGVLLLTVAPVSLGGGGGNGDGSDILPAWLQSYVREKGLDVCEIVAEISAGGWNGAQVRVQGPTTDVTVTFLPAIPTGPGESAQTPVAVTGTMKGQTVVAAGWALPGPDGKLRIADANDLSENLILCVGEHYCFFTYWRLDPGEFGDGDADDDFCGYSSDNSGGAPRGREVNYH
jgi:hypothetical protein